MRYKIFDVIRGLAIVFMVFANAAPIFHGKFPFLMQVLFSLAAPIFIMISGLLLALGASKHPFSYFLKRAIFIVGIAVLIDVAIHRQIPFQGFDVLYLIGFSIPLVIIALRLPVYAQFLLIVAVLSVSELAHWMFGYRPTDPVYPLSFQTLLTHIVNFDLKHWTIDCDFPIFPWLAVMLFGGLIGQLFVKSKDADYFQSKRFLGIVVGMIMVGVVLVGLNPPLEFPIVNGYAEIFYPASAGLLICLTLPAVILLAFSRQIQNFNLLSELGRSCLAIYTFHLLLIEISIAILGPTNSLLIYCLLFVWHFTVVCFISHLLVRFKNNHQKLPTLVAWFIGT